MTAHRWQPITGLEFESCNIDFQEIDSLHRRWLSFRSRAEKSDSNAYRAFLERVYRRWSIETGIIEGIYDIDRGTTQVLAENGLSADLIDRTGTNRDPNDLVRVLRDHRDTAEFVTDSIAMGKPLSKHYIRELHQLLMRNQPIYTAVNQSGITFETELDRGGFKMQPNNPMRPDGKIHEYCPPEQVESELDSLIELCEEAQRVGDRHQLLVAAWLHHRFTQIHPFQDGNGRVARALLIWHLAKEEYLPVVVSRDDREAYFDALESADAGRLDPLVEFIVRLERRTILEALGEPAPVAESGLVSQILDHISERIKKRHLETLEELRSVNAFAESLQEAVRELLASQAEAIRQQLGQAGLIVSCVVDWGGPGNREHWYRDQVVRTAMTANHWANLNENRYFIKLSVNPEGYRPQTPRFVFVVSLHHVGRQLTGIMAATAFAQMADVQDSGREYTEVPNEPDFKNCALEAFTFTSGDNTDRLGQRFDTWIEGALAIGLRHWSEFIS